MITSSSPLKEAIRKPTIFSRMFEIAVLISNICGNGPLFRLFALIAFGGAYLIPFPPYWINFSPHHKSYPCGSLLNLYRIISDTRI